MFSSSFSDLVFGFLDGPTLSIAEGDEEPAVICVGIVNQATLEIPVEVEIQHSDTPGSLPPVMAYPVSDTETFFVR